MYVIQLKMLWRIGSRKVSNQPYPSRPTKKGLKVKALSRQVVKQEWWPRCLYLLQCCKPWRVISNFYQELHELKKSSRWIYFLKRTHIEVVVTAGERDKAHRFRVYKDLIFGFFEIFELKYKSNSLKWCSRLAGKVWNLSHILRGGKYPAGRVFVGIVCTPFFWHHQMVDEVGVRTDTIVYNEMLYNLVFLYWKMWTCLIAHQIVGSIQSWFIKLNQNLKTLAIWRVLDNIDYKVIGKMTKSKRE